MDVLYSSVFGYWLLFIFFLFRFLFVVVEFFVIVDVKVINVLLNFMFLGKDRILIFNCES